MIVPFTIEKLLGWAAIGAICVVGVIFGILYLRKQTFCVRRRNKRIILFLFWLLLIMATAATFRVEKFDSWMFLASTGLLATISIYKEWSQGADLVIYDIDPARAIVGLRASLREKNYVFEEDGTGSFVLTELYTRITLKSFTWSASTDVNFIIPRDRPEKRVITYHLCHILSGQSYGKFPWIGLVLTVISAIGIVFLIVV